MTTFNANAFVRSFATATCAVLVGGACVAGAVAPAQASAAERPMDKAQWTRAVADRLTTEVRPANILPEFILAKQVAVVGAHFDAAGSFTGVTMEQPTRYRALDREALRATAKLSYPMLPAAMRGLPRVVAIRVVFSNNVDPAALARTDSVANQVASRYARTGAEIANR